MRPSVFARFPLSKTCALVLASASAAACFSRAHTSSGPSLTPVGETTGLSHPESARYDSARNVFYVSNINGDPSAHDGNGFIDVVSADTYKVLRTLVQGGVDGAQLSAPKGLALSGDTLWVADLDTLRAFDVRSGHTLETISLTRLGATFLNDVTVGGDGAVYITDTGKGDADGSGSAIFRVHAGIARLALATPALAAPNGITWDAIGQRFLLAPGGKAIQTWVPGEPAPVPLMNGPGGYDGIEILPDRTMLVTSWADSALHRIRAGVMTPVVRGLSGPADIGIDTRNGVVAVPRLLENRVEYFRLP